jgi:hypothetical protein
LKGRHFGTLDYIQKSVTGELKGIQQKPSSTATNNKNNASVAVWLANGTILKGTALI